jgi:hypothetical protein
MEIRNLDPLKPHERTDWVYKTAVEVRHQWSDKFEKGQKEHAGDIGTVPVLELLRQMEQEALDQLAYVRELRRRMIPTVQETAIEEGLGDRDLRNKD